MRTRVISGVALVAGLVVVLLAGQWPFLLLILLASLLATHEFYSIAQQGGIQPAYYVGMAAAFALIGDIVYTDGSYELLILAATFMLALLWQVATLRPVSSATENALTGVTQSGMGTARALLRGEGVTLSSDQLRQGWLNIGFTVGGVLYIAWLLRLGWLVYNYCRSDRPCQPNSILFGLEIGPGIWWVVLAVVATSFADSGAYFVGRRFGKRKLIPWISPAKTVEGLLGGIVAATLGVLLMTPLVGIGWYNALILGPLLALVSVAGDLIESRFKRAMKVKDSGNIIPGHGGILDRIDSIITTVVAVFLYITYAQFLFVS